MAKRNSKAGYSLRRVVSFTADTGIRFRSPRWTRQLLTARRKSLSLSEWSTLRGFILNLIELYCLIKESSSVDDAIIDWAQKVKQERKLKVFLLTMTSWLCGQPDWRDSQKSLRRLGELTIRLVRECDEEFPSRIEDRTACRLGKIMFPNVHSEESLLLRFYERFKETQDGIPGCDLCRFREWQQRDLSRKALTSVANHNAKRIASIKGMLLRQNDLRLKLRRPMPARNAGYVNDWATRS